MVSALLGFMAVSGYIGKNNISRLRFEIELPDEIYDGVETLAGVVLHNEKRMPSFLISLKLPGEEKLFPVVPGRDNTRLTAPVTMTGRGKQDFPDLTFRSVFPVNFFVRGFTINLDKEVTVFPTPNPCSAPGSDGRPWQSGEAPSPRRGSDGDIERIAHYRGNEPLKMIHWKLSARQNELMVKETADTAREPVEIDLDSIPGQNIEERLRCAAYLVNKSSRENRPVGLKLPNRRLVPALGKRHRHHLLTELALYGQD